MLIFIPPWRTAVFFARIVMPFSRSRSIESITRSATSWFSRNEPDCQSIASTSVVFPWSTCATIATFRRSVRVALGTAGQGSDGISPARAGLEPFVHVAELWRYPVKSMRGEKIETTRVEDDGIPGARLVDTRQGDDVRARHAGPGRKRPTARRAGGRRTRGARLLGRSAGDGLDRRSRRAPLTFVVARRRWGRVAGWGRVETKRRGECASTALLLLPQQCWPHSSLQPRQPRRTGRGMSAPSTTVTRRRSTRPSGLERVSGAGER